MFIQNKILAIIPARGGSKGVPKKNIRNVNGKSLIAWTIEAANQSKYLDKTILSSDSQEIADVATTYGCEVPFLRPDHLAKDETPMSDVVLHAIDVLQGYDYVVLLQPTSPQRLAKDIDLAIELCLKGGFNACVSVTESAKNPSWMFFLEEDCRLQPVLPDMRAKVGELQRQALRKSYVLNGAIYIAKIDWYRQNMSFVSGETVAYEMPQYRSIDIDTEWDMGYFEYLLTRNRDDNSKEN